MLSFDEDVLEGEWTYEEIYEIKIDHNIKSNQPQLKRFILDILDTNRKRHELTFATEFRVELLTDLLRIHATKVSWSESTYDVILDIGPISIDVLNPRTGELWKTYNFKDIECISKHIFLTREPDNLIKEVNKSAHSNLSVSFSQPSSPLTRDYCTEYRLGKVNQDHLISQAEFTVQKLSNRYGATNQMKTVSRLMCLTESLLLERDPTSYRPVSAHPLCEIHLLVRDRFQPQRFSIEYVRGQIATYFSTNRDALLASLLDGVRASGNRDVYVSSSFSDRSLRFIPLMNSATEEVESVHLRFLQGVSFWEVVQRFNANIAYSGLLHAVTQDGVFAENKEKLIKDALVCILTHDTRIIDANPLTSIRRSSSSSLHYTTDNNTTNNNNTTTTTNPNYELILIEAQFHALRRLVASKAGFNAFTQLPGMRVTLGQLVVNALKLRDDAVTHSVLDAINTLMHPMHDQPDIRQEQLNKASIMSSEIFLSHLVDIFTLHAHPSLAIVRGGGMIMRALIEEGGTDVAKELRSLALTEGALLHHFWTACFTQGNDPRSLAVQQLSRQLVALWSENNQDAWDLFKRMLPLGLLSFLESTEEPPVKLINMLPDRDNLQLAHEHMMRIEERKQTISYQLESKIDDLLTHWRLRVGLPIPKVIGKQNHIKEAEERPVVLRRPRHLLQSLRGDSVNCKPTTNWRLFFYQFQQDHAKADLIWTIRTRNELRESMEKELQEFQQERNYFAQSRLEESDLPDFDRSEPIGTGQPERIFPIGLTSKAQSTPNICNNNNNGTMNEHSQLSPMDHHPSTIETNQFDKHDNKEIKLNSSKIQNSNDHNDTQTLSRSSNLNRRTRTSVSPTRIQADHLINQASLVSWNYREFKVNYPSLIEEPRVGNYFLRLLLEEDRHVNEVIDATTLTNANSTNVTAFFNELFRRYLQYVASDPYYSINDNSIKRCTTDCNNITPNTLRRLTMRCLCLHAMSVNNVMSFVDADGVRVLIDLACLAHLHTNRAPTPFQSNVLKASSEQEFSGTGANTQREWWYINTTQTEQTTNGSITKSGSHSIQGPVSFYELQQLIKDGCINNATKVYAQGLDATPRCRPDGYLAEDDFVDIKEDSNNFNKSSNQSQENHLNNDTISLDHSEQMNEKTIACGMYGWMPAKRIVQIRWTLSDISNMKLSNSSNLSTRSNPTIISSNNNNNNTNNSMTGNHEINVGCLIDKLSYTGGMFTNYTSLAIKCIDILRRLCDSCSSRDLHGGVVRPLPKPRRAISDMNCLPHVIQLLLTFDPPLVERVVSLLHAVMDQNPFLPRLYLTGIFYFILLYTGSNVLPIAKFLKDVHLLQALRLDEFTGSLGIDLTSRSILGNMLPDAMIAYLENHPPEKFAEIFLGDFDSPEAIWNSEMRRYMIGRITSHLADFSPRLHSNIRAIYRFIGMPIIIYPQLENELFCHNYYLRHLCDLQRFPDWPIRDPVALLRDILKTWRDELQKKPVNMSYEEALSELGLDPALLNSFSELSLCKHTFPYVALLRDILKTWRDELQKKPVNMSYEEALSELGLDPALLNSSNEESFIRRAYYQMSMKYHPDKNPNGREKFQSLTKAYQFLCNRSKLSRGPNRLHIQLMLRAQSIVYKRYRSLLISEKYAGYPMLVATILAEISDDKLFSYGTQKSEDQTENTDTTTTTNNSQSSTSNNKNRSNETVDNAVLLVAATELTYETVVTSVLNAEELRRENGIPVLQKAFSQCSNFLSRISSRPGHIVVEVCGHIVSVLAAASLFPSSRQCIQETPQLLKDTLRLLYYKNLPKLCCLTATCIASFCIDYWLCVTCYEYGGLFLLLQHVLSYDFTLEEAGVEINEETNSQVS
ncbi:DnaJ subfamily C member 13 [Schistosoma bovis]|uniref:DnaJ subfamily C member 13 n=1 Tax=Schistosoma bovis TaxID=6184 RepID=A0A430Q8Y1_SCHBO|nr:DnaJ subfamily C member 13 [Schistosoma bovis]